MERTLLEGDTRLEPISCNNGKMNQVVLTMEPNRPGHLYIGLPSIRGESIKEAIFVYYQCRAQVKAHEFEVIPMFETGCTPSLEKWAAARGLDSNDKTTRLAFFHDMSLNYKEALDRVWNEQRMGASVFFDAFFFSLPGEIYQPATERFSHEFKTPEALRLALTNELTQRLGQDCEFFISPQVLKANDLMNNWMDFYNQGVDRLVHGLKYFRHKYDIQEYLPGEDILPLYAIPVSVKKTWSRTFTLLEYVEFTLALEHTLFDGMSNPHSLLQDISAQMVERKLFNRSDARELCTLFTEECMVMNYIMRESQAYRKKGKESPDTWDCNKIRKKLGLRQLPGQPQK